MLAAVVRDSSMSHAKLFLLLPILLLLGLGLMITLRDGLEEGAGRRTIRQLAGNLAKTILTAGGWLAGMTVLQRLAGFRVSFGW
jgi:hypothetical protein